MDPLIHDHFIQIIYSFFFLVKEILIVLERAKPIETNTTKRLWKPEQLKQALHINAEGQ